MRTYQQVLPRFLRTIGRESAKRHGQRGQPEIAKAAQGFFYKRNNHMMSKSELIQKIADDVSLPKKDVKAVIESLATVGYKEMKKTGTFLLPGFAKFVVIKKPATKERTGINPFTKEPTVFKAKPARKVLKVRPVKAAKDAV
jgi:nucleoid DNA-binding protein